MPRGRPDGSGASPLGVTAGIAALLLAIATAASAGAADRAASAVGDAGAADRAASAVGHAGAGPTEDPSPTERGWARPETAGGAWFSLGLLAGTTQFDAGLADYQWNTLPRIAWGAQSLAGTGRFATGLRLWSTRTSQAIGELGEAPSVQATTIELVGEGRIAKAWGIQLLATAGAGRLHLGYHPDRITIQPSGPAGAIEVNLEPVDTWIGGGGLALRRALLPGWAVALGFDHRVFAMDTAHRAGNAIVMARESFGDWSARFELARVHRRR